MALFPAIPTPRPRARPAAARVTRRLLPADWLYDPVAGDLVVLPGGDVPITNGYRAWVNDWYNTLVTQQAAWPIYSRAYAVDHQNYMQLPTRGQVESAYMARLRRIADRRPDTREVRKFRFQWLNDECDFSFEIVAITGDTVSMGIEIHT